MREREKRGPKHTRRAEEVAAFATSLPPGTWAVEWLPRPDVDHPVPAASSHRASRLSISAFLFLFWLAGVAGVGAVFLRRCLALRRVLRGARSLGDGDMLAQEMARLAADMALRRAPRLVASAAVTTPLVIGPLRPVVVFPENLPAALSPDERRLALAHELAHLRRGDL